MVDRKAAVFDPKQVTIGGDVIMGFVKNLLDFPYSQICRHLVAHDLLTTLAENGLSVPEELLSAITKANDEDAKEIIAKLEGHDVSVSSDADDVLTPENQSRLKDLEAIGIRLSPRDPSWRIGFEGTHMVSQILSEGETPDNSSAFCIVGNNVNDLVLDAFNFWSDDIADALNKMPDPQEHISPNF